MATLAASEGKIRNLESVMRRATRPRISTVLGTIGAVLAAPGWTAVPAALEGSVPCGGSVTVESGDTLADIAALCGVPAGDIVSVNPDITDINQLFPGQSIVIPGAVAVGAPVADLETLLAPIALYPDALLAEILPAATYPLELVQAERWLQANPSGDADSQNWAPSVAALTRYPEVLSALSSDIDSTIQIGDAFLADPDNVFAAIQTLRQRAQGAGNLASNDYQEVIVEPIETTTRVEVVEPVVEVREVIRIVPRYSHRIYVPTYDPYWAYYRHPNYYRAYGRPLFSFGIHYGYGAWLSHYIDWGYYHVGVFPRAYRRAHYHFYPRRYLNRYSHSRRYWYHQPVHRHGYRYTAQPRVRIREGQRHLINVASSRQRQQGSHQTYRNDYRGTERNRAIERSNTRSSRDLSARIVANDNRQRVRAGDLERRAQVAPAQANRNAATRQQRTTTTARRNSADATRATRQETLRRLQQSSTRQQPVTRSTTRRSAPAEDRQGAVRQQRPQTTQRLRQDTRQGLATSSSRVQRSTEANRSNRQRTTTTQRRNTEAQRRQAPTQRTQRVQRSTVPQQQRATRPQRSEQRSAPQQRRSSTARSESSSRSASQSSNRGNSNRRGQRERR